jgi:hypothetical protein
VDGELGITPPKNFVLTAASVSSTTVHLSTVLGSFLLLVEFI